MRFKRIGCYDVTALIGEGGMGQVYQATDTNLDRQVAIKVLPDAFASDADRLARFEREAKVLASLNHPNIGAIYGLEKSGDIRALVLELVEGPTLADRIAQGPIPLDEALPIAKQIAEALEAAHEQGVIHRDLKPANIKVKAGGTVKVLDFGLAKALDTTPEGDPSQSPTLTAAATQMDVIMGTAAYMSPEQARGKTVDKRADIWSFGVVLLEMLTGRKVFEGEDVSMTLSSVLQREPDWSHLPSAVSPSLSVFLHRCLEKDPKQRVGDIRDVRLAMEGAFDVASAVSLGAGALPQLSVWRRPVLVVAVVGLGAVAAGLAVWSAARGPEREPSVLRAIVTPDGDTVLSRDAFQPGLAISPDGATLVYRGRAGSGNVSLYRRPLDALDAQPLGPEEAVAPFFSPDGNSVGFITPESGRTRLYRTFLTGGAVRTVATFPSIVSGASWGIDDQIVVGQGTGGLLRVPAEGGEPEVLTVLDEALGEVAHRWPSIADELGVVFFSTAAARTGNAGSQLAACDLETGTIVRLDLTGTAPRYVSTGHLIYVGDGGVLQAVPFDPDQLAVRGAPVDIADTVALRANGASDYAVSDTGRLAYIPGGSSDATGKTLVWVNRDTGGVTPASAAQEDLGYPRLSPDEFRVVYWKLGDVWFFDLVRQSHDRFAFEQDALYPFWSHDGAAIIFASSRAGTFDIYSKPADSSGDYSLIVGDPNILAAGSVSPDGQHLLYHRAADDGQRDLWTLPMGGVPAPFLQTGFNETSPILSPDGRSVAYMSDSSGERRVYIQPFPSGGQVASVSEGPGVEPTWSRDGRELFYRNGERMMKVDIRVDANGNIVVGRAEPLFVGAYVPDSIGYGVANYDVLADGQRFLMVSEVY